ncbi:MAG: DnaJ family domain-containing protein [Desulfatirhabdiaceae bacterium]
MITGFEDIVEKRILNAIRNGEFDNLPGVGEPIVIEDDSHIPEDLRLSHKILKNAGCLPPEIELKKEIYQTQDLLQGLEGTTEKYRVLKRLNFLIMKLNDMRKTNISMEMPQQYADLLAERLCSKSTQTS